MAPKYIMITSCLHKYDPYSETQKDGVYIHATNQNGFAGEGVKKNKKPYAISTGCLLIYGPQWTNFCDQVGHHGFHLVLTRK